MLTTAFNSRSSQDPTAAEAGAGGGARAGAAATATTKGAVATGPNITGITGLVYEGGAAVAVAVAAAEGPGKLEGPTKNEQHFPRFIVASFTHTPTYFILIYRKRARIRAIISAELTTCEYSMNYGETILGSYF